MHLDFSLMKMTIEWHFEEEYHISETCSSVCDSLGSALIWTNGMQIFGKGGVIIANQISYDFGTETEPSYWEYFYSDTYGPFGFPKHDAALVIPIPNESAEIVVISHTSDVHSNGLFQPNQYLESKILKIHEEEFQIAYKDKPIFDQKIWYTGPILACRHGNGSDWWIVLCEVDSKNYYSFILGSNGLQFHHKGSVDQLIQEGLGQATFSPLGNYMARMDAITLDEGQYISLFSFDRCSGDFIYLDQFHTEAGYFTGVAFSPNERYLYADEDKTLWQWDLWASDIAGSQIVVDTFDGFIEPGWFGTRFGPMKLAPDGRIYISTPGGSSKRFHVVDRPDLPGKSCRFLQHHINLEKWNGRSMPNIPNYRLGPLDGSPCDTLGLNNHPVSRWRYEEDEPGYPELIRFTDLSFFDPQEWYWEFGDGNSSDIPSPLHTFEPGIYHVCLTVSNEYATDSSCQWIEIIPTSIREEMQKDLPPYSFSPNPFLKEITIASRSGDFESVHLRIHDMHGRLILEQPTLTIPSRIVLPDYPPGIYLIGIENEEGGVYSVKMMKR
jgi:hypothetical protein